jgi:uncharacterized protein
MVSSAASSGQAAKFQPCIYEGRVFHRRRATVNHEFSYDLFFAFLDVDRLEALCRESQVVKYNRLGLVCFDERDHFGDPRLPLRKRLEVDARLQGVKLPDGPIYLLTHLRHFGYCFNPASIFYCYDASGQPVTHCVEVRNHFGERRTYWVGQGTAHPFDEQGIARHPKSMHVSPYLPMTGDYLFSSTEPDDRLRIRIDFQSSGQSAAVETGVFLNRSPWTKAAVQKAVDRFPRLSFDIALWIYQEAARLSLKGVRFFLHPDGKLPRMPLP